MRARWPLLAFVLGAVAALSAISSDSAGAHALLLRADPPVNSQLREPPSEITLYFSEPLEQQYSRVTVSSQTGEQVDAGVEFLAEDDAAMRVLLVESISPGYLNVEWVTVSQVDGHRISGSFPITILNEDGSLPAGTPPAEGSSITGEEPEIPRVIDKWVLLLAGSVLIGALAFTAYIRPVRQEADVAQPAFSSWVIRISIGALVLLVLAGFVDLAYQANDIDTSIGNALDTQWGERWLYRHLLLVPVTLLLAALVLRLSNTRLIAVSALVLVFGYIVLWASTSHAGAGGGSFWAVMSDAVHLIASAVWIGSLFVLLALFVWAGRHVGDSERYTVLSSALQRFSMLAMLSVALLLLTGTINATIQLGAVGDLFDTDYGLALFLKLLLLLPLLLVAGFNAYLLRPDFVEASDPETRVQDRAGILEHLERQLYRRIRVELAIAVAVIAVVAVLIQLTPTRGRLAPPDRGPGEYVETVDVDDLQATLVITPNEPGFNTFEVYLAGGVDTVEGLRLEFTEPSGFTGESRLSLDASNPPTFYLGEGPYLSDSGVWNITLNIRRSQGDDLRPVFQVDVDGSAVVEVSSRTGGQFASPINFSPTAVTVLLLSGVVSIIIVTGSIGRSGMPEGYLGWLAAEVAYRAPTNVRPVWALGGLVVIGIALGLVLGTHIDQPLSSEEASRENPVEATEESIARGAILFSANCTICHGESGRGDGPAAPSLSLQPANLYDHIPFHPDQFFFGVISKGLGGVMPAFEGQLSEADRWNLLNYLRDTFGEPPSDR